MELDEQPPAHDSDPPVMGVVLMVAAAVFLTAAVGTVALGFDGAARPAPPDAEFDVRYDDPELVVVHEGGASLDGERLRLVSTTTATDWGGGPVRAGDARTLDRTDGDFVRDSTVHVVWVAGALADGPVLRGAGVAMAAPRADNEWRVHAADRREYWSWVAGALYLLLSVDLLSTLYAAGLYGAAAEANPYVQWALTRDVAVLVGLNLLALAVLAALFYGYIRLLTSARGVGAWVMARTLELWVGCLVAAGLIVFANNLSVIVHGQSLL